MSKGNGCRSIVVPTKELNQLRKIADKSDKKGFDYPSRTTAARAAIYLALHHEWTREEIAEAFRQVGEDEEEPETLDPNRAQTMAVNIPARSGMNGGEQE